MTNRALSLCCFFIWGALLSCKSTSSQVKDHDSAGGDVRVDQAWAGSMRTSMTSTKTAVESLNTAAESLVDASETAEFLSRAESFNDQLAGISQDLNAALTSMIVKLNASPYDGSEPYTRVVSSEFSERSARFSNMANVQVPQLYKFSNKYVILAQGNAPAAERRSAERALFRAIEDLTIEIGASLQVIEDWITLAQSGGGSGGGTANRRARYVVEGFYVTGSEFRNSGEASSSWQTVCDQSIEKLRVLLDRTGVGRDNIESYNCGSMQNISRSSNIGYFQYGSPATATVVLEGNITTQKGLIITGDESQLKDLAYSSWRHKCFTMADTVRQRYPTAVAATCGTPTNVSSHANINYYTIQSPTTIWLKVPDGALPTQTFNDNMAIGPEFRDSQTSAMDGFNTSCNDVRTTFQTLLDERLKTFECGDPRNGSPHANINYISYFASPVVTVTMPLGTVTQSGAVIQGEEYQNRIYEAWQSWWRKCKTKLVEAKAQAGQRFAYATCGAITNASTHSNIGYVQYRSTMKVFLTPLQ